jgi:signal transduction histidine kinase/CheY-like chemotaxis protein
LLRVMTLFLGNMDFVFLIYGLAFFLLATVSFSMAQIRGQGISWVWLGLFAVFHGLNEWLDMLAPAVGYHHVFDVLRSVFLILSFLFLFEFGRRNVVWSGGRRAGWWVYLPPLLLLYAVDWRFGHNEALSSCRTLLAFPGGLLASLALWQWGTPAQGGKRYHRHVIAPLAMVAYAVLSGLVAPKTDFGMTAFFNTDSFLLVTGIPVQLFRCAVACTIALVIWYEHFVWRVNHFSSPAMKWIVRVEGVATVLFVAILIGGFVAINQVHDLAENESREELIDLSRMIVAAINADCVKIMKADPSDMTDPVYAKFLSRWQRIVDSSKDVRHLYMLRRHAGEWRFVINVEPRQYKGAGGIPMAKPGEAYRDAPAEIDLVYKRASTLVSRPSPDHPGRFVSAYAPIPNPETGQVEGVLGVSLLASQLDKVILQKRLPPLLCTALVALLMMMFIMIWLQLREDAELRHVAMVRARNQQDVLWQLANSAAFKDGSVFIAWREISEATGRVMGVDRVDILTCLPGQVEFQCEDAYDVERDHHAAGSVYSREKTGFLKDLFAEGRTLAVDDLASDPRMKDMAVIGSGQDIGAAILAPFRAGGTIEGVIVFSQTKGNRKWQNDEVRFAAEVAGLMSHGLMNREKDRAEKALSKAHEELEERVRLRTEELFKRNKQLNLEIEERKKLEEEREKLEAQVRQAQKLECLGVMAGGIAHDFNNILMAILGNAELAKFETDPSSPVFGYVQDIEKAAARAATLSRQMLAYSGRGNSQIQPIDLNAMVREIVGMLEVSVSKKVTFIYNLEESLKTLDGDSAQIGQIVMNLVINAAEAIGEEAGVITLQSGTIWCDSGMLVSMWMHDKLPEGEYVYLDVQDTGAGMDPGTLSRIFDPFFTTKFTGRGLGLAAVLGIVRAHRGLIDVCSEKGCGTTFRVLFPVGKMAAKKTTSSHVAAESAPQGGLILLVDDEEAVRSLGLKFIERMGYKAIVASDGLDAIVKFRERQGEIRCVLLDLMMPKYDGHETLVELRKLNSEVKVIMCSGYTEEDVSTRFADWKVAGFIEKPYSYETLSAQLDSVLKRNPGNDGWQPT